MPSEDVIELSIEETNKLRAKLGLKPLRTGTKRVPGAGSETSQEPPSLHGGGTNNGEEILDLSVEETNKLREKLGLSPLRETGSTQNKNKEIHKPAENTGLQEEATRRIEQAKLRRQVRQGAAQVFGSSTLADDLENEGDKNQARDGSTAPSSWVDMMRRQKKESERNNVKKEQQLDHRSRGYGETDLEGMQVRNRMADLAAGENTVLTLADAPILESKTHVSNKVISINQEEDALENVQLNEKERHQDGLRRKRMLEMGMGRAGGYAGFDDDEFEELGGTLGPSNQERGCSKEKPRTGQGFRIGSYKKASVDSARTDYDKVMKGEAISLVWKGDVVTSDYLTREEELEAKQKKKNKGMKFKKKKKKSKKKRRKYDVHEDEDDEADDTPMPASATVSVGSILSKLENSVDKNKLSGLQKRRRIDDSVDNEEGAFLADPIVSNTSKNSTKQPRTNRMNYDKIMEKANERTNKAFNTDNVQQRRETTTMDEEPDDSFLTAALAKARRLNRLREMNKVSSTGADVVAEAVKSTSMASQNSTKSSGISFSIDDTREFSRAIRARTQQNERETTRKTLGNSTNASMSTNASGKETEQSTDKRTDELVTQDHMENDGDTDNKEMEELAKEVQEDSIQYGFDGSAVDSVGVGRGLSGFISMLKTTGEITGRHGGKEELRGRAKDERNYDNYEPLDLSKVVAIGKNATSKDEEFANREIKLEYRDKHGRKLTTKEAYRDLCYQFHGHGASKRKEEKRLKQIEREQAEARMASRQLSAARDGTTAGTLGALKATQKATGKAFVVHKT